MNSDNTNGNNGTAPAAGTAPKSDADLARAMYGNTGPLDSSRAESGDAPKSDAELARAMYGDGEVRRALEAKDTAMYEVLGATAAQRTEMKNTFTDIAKDGAKSGLSMSIVAALGTAYIDAEIAAARAEDPDALAKTTAQTIEKSNRELRAKLAQLYGTKEAEALLARTQRFVQANPKLSKVLGKHGLGSRPEFVEPIVHHVFINGLGR